MGIVDKFCDKTRYSFGDFVEIIKVLRSPQGCPWDREQTHESIRKNFIEETYEVLEAIDIKDAALLQEELGDVMLQIMLHSQMESENGNFDVEDVIDGVCKKMVYRHPHVFGNVKADTSEKVLANWDKLKRVEKQQKSDSETLKSVAVGMPALMRADKIQKKASKVGFDWDSTSGAMDKLDEEIEELKTAILNNDKNNMLEELGDVLFSVVNVARFLGIDSEEALTWSTNKFIDRFQKVEDKLKQQGRRISDADVKELDDIWKSVK